VKHFQLSWLAVLLVVPPLAHASGKARPTVGELSVVAESPFQLHIATTAPITPQVQMISGPDRLVIDLPDALPSAALHRLAVNQGSVKRVRTSLYSRQPLVTRVVVDLISPQWYRIAPDASGVLVTVGGPSTGASNDANTVGWVSTRSPFGKAVRPASVMITNRAAPVVPRELPGNGVTVDFANGLLTIHARNATLSEVLFQIQKKTGAEIAIPAGTEQQRVAADFGPDTPSAVLEQLLNGSGLNFVVVGAEGNPNVLRSVLLSRKGPDADAAIFSPYSPPVAQNVQPERTDPNVMPGIDGSHADQPEFQTQQPQDSPPQDNPQ
jgi:AMIN domain